MDATTELLTRDQIPEEVKWDLNGLYSSFETWEADFLSLESQLEAYASYQGTLAESAERLKQCLKFDMQFSQSLEAVYTYAHLKSDEDKTNSQNQANYERVTRLLSQYQQARSFIKPELMEIPEETMQKFLQDPELDFYRFHLEQELRHRPHTLPKQEEMLLASMSEVAHVPSKAFTMLDNADLQLGSVKDEAGREVTLTHGNFQSLLQKQDRRVRRDAFETYYRAYDAHQHTFSALLGGSIKKDLFFAQARRFPSVREMALFSENIPVEVYDNLIDTVHRKLNPLYKYFDLRKRILELDSLHVYDCAVPLVRDIHWDMPYEKAVEEIGRALQPLGTEYVNTVTRGLLDERWVDRYENKGKRSGAYSSGCYESNPFILMNYRSDHINSVYTLAHEAGHSMHSYFSIKNQPYLYADYTIFVAEVASTFNEALLTRYFLNKQDLSREMKIYLLCREIDNFRGTLYRQTMFAEFEHRIYAAAEAGKPLTVEAFKEMYHELLETYFGGGVTLDPCLDLECFRIPHFYFGFYVYKYATGISAAYALADRVLSGGEAELADYLTFLKSGGSAYPIDLLRRAGVDMSSPEPIETALNKFTGLVDQLESLTG